MKHGRKLSVAEEAAVVAEAAVVVMAAAAAAMAVEAAGAEAAVVAAAEIVETAEIAGKRPPGFRSDVFIPRDAAGNLPWKFSEIVVCLPAALSLATFGIEVRLIEHRADLSRAGSVARLSVHRGRWRASGGEVRVLRQGKFAIGYSISRRKRRQAPLMTKVTKPGYSPVATLRAKHIAR
jgi:hypothetical protein